MIGLPDSRIWSLIKASGQATSPFFYLFFYVFYCVGNPAYWVSSESCERGFAELV